MIEEKFWENGRIRIRCERDESGVLNGLYQSWYSNGKKSCECRFVNGTLEGCRRQWRPDGKLYSYVVYHEGVPVYLSSHVVENITPEMRRDLERYQPVKVKDGWLQLSMDGTIRSYKNSPEYIHDEVGCLAKRLQETSLK